MFSIILKKNMNVRNEPKPLFISPPKKNALLLNADEILWLIADIHKKGNKTA